MKVYLVIFNGKVSNEAYKTLKEAEDFCKSRGAKKVINRWLFTDNDDVYQITDVIVRQHPTEKGGGADAGYKTDVWFVQCNNCCATFPHFDSKAEAIVAWNTRTPQKEG